MVEADNPTPESIAKSGRHAFIEASAGSGKTTCLVDIVTALITSEAAEIGQILCVTFTEKAASELKAKIYRKLAGVNNKAAAAALTNFARNEIGTIHEFCLRYLTEDRTQSLSQATGITMSETDLFEEAREYVYRVVWASFGDEKLAAMTAACRFGAGGNSREFDADLRKKAIFCFGNPAAAIIPPVSSAELVSDADSFRSFTLYCIVEKMREVARTRGVLTFAGMITGLAEAIRDEAFAERLRSRFNFALIDEFQDTDQVQWEIFHRLFLDPNGKKKQRLIVVGDPKQAIYKFRGADVFVYLQAKAEMRTAGAMFVNLATNYRSANELIAAQNHIFSAPAVAEVWQRMDIAYHEPGYGEKTKSTGDDCTGFEFFRAVDYHRENEVIFAAQAAARIEEIRRRHSDWKIAVIAFRHAALANVAEVLREHGIRCAYYKERPDFRTTEIGHLQILLQALALPHDEGYALACSTIFVRTADQPGEYYAVLSALAAQQRIKALLLRLAHDMRPLHHVLEVYPDSTRYHTWRILFRVLLEKCGDAVHDLATLRKAIFDLAETTDDDKNGDMLVGKDAVTLLTVQSSKGLDWDAVVLADGIHDKFWNDFAFYHDSKGNAVVPASIAAFDASQDKWTSSSDEAKLTQLNLLYVALTRAKNKFIGLVGPAYRSTPPGPVARYLLPWSEDVLRRPDGITFRPLEAVVPAQPQKAAPAPAAAQTIDHGNIPLRVAERTSFTALSQATFTDTIFSDDILPRGAHTGQLLHNILEHCRFSAFAADLAEAQELLMPQALAAAQALPGIPPERLPIVADRVVEIVSGCATAVLPLAKGGETTLAKILPDNLWREMPFWSSAEIHRVLREKKPITPSQASAGTTPISLSPAPRRTSCGEPRRTMHGYMDLVFTADGEDYYILDYKSNSLADIAPENISHYTTQHYGLQAEIYAEALSAYLATAYPKKKVRVAGCYFIYLRYLKPGETTGVHFINLYANADR